MYPTRYVPQTNFPREEQLTDEISTTALQAEYARISESISQIVTSLRRITTADGRLQLDQAVRLNDVITEIDLGTGDGVTTTFAFPQEIDAAVDLVRTFGDDVRIDPDSYDDTEVTFAVAPAGGVVLTALVYTNLAGVLDRLQSVVSDEGASMVGIADTAGLFTASNVEDALAELGDELESLLTALGDLGGYVLRDGSRTLTGQWEVNERTEVTIEPAAAVGSFRVNANPADEDYVEIDDGVTTVRFEFDDDAAVTSGNVSVTIGATAADSAQNIVDAINGSPLAVKAELSGQNVSLTHEIPYALGNQPLVTSGAAITSVVGMAGGVDGSFSAAYKTHFRVRNHPRSLRDGDVVVHEQLQDVTGQIEAALTAFLRTDGANQMTGPLNVGGNRVINVDDAVQPTDAVNLSQAQDLISDAGDTKLSLIGTKDTVAEGTLTGPVTLGRTSSETADTDQTSNPSLVAVNTIHGVPKPGASNHVANRAYVDEAIAAIVIGGGTVFPSFNIDGDGLGGGGLANINNGGEFFFEDLVIAAAQSLAIPATIYVEGDFTLQNTGSITSAAPIELIVTGDVTIAGAISCPGLIIRCGGAVTISAAITTAVNGTYTRKYTQEVHKKFGYPVDGTNGTFADDWRPFILDAVGALAISAAITADDVFMKTGGNLTVSSTITARWYYSGSAFNFHTGASPYLAPGWRDQFKTYQATGGNTAAQGTGGSGGTAGGAGGVGNGGGTAGPASIWLAAHQPYLLPTYALARGGFGSFSTTTSPSSTAAENGRGGGRISVYADGNAVLSGALFRSPGGAGSDLPGGDNAGGGGAGTIRVGCKGTMTDGTFNAVGGAGDGNADGGGGSAWAFASAFAGTQSASVVSGGAGGGAGVSDVAITLTSAQIEALKQLSLFEVVTDAA